jgi:hypothetical protein
MILKLTILGRNLKIKGVVEVNLNYGVSLYEYK